MTIQSGMTLALAMLALAASPGPGVFATTSRALASGMRPALSMILGIVAGDVAYLLLATFGLSVIANALGELFFVVRLLGGIYLMWLGVRMCLKEPTPPAGESGERDVSRAGNFASGLVITLSNPKVIVFYGGFLPTFMDLSALCLADLAVVVAIVSAVLSSVMVCYALLATRVRGLISSRRAAKRLNRVAGTAMVATGAVILARQ
jgi:threonine/homoserine/homoserine lactone efflux protein